MIAFSAMLSLSILDNRFQLFFGFGLFLLFGAAVAG
jgi:hypothetical protein